MAIKEDRRTTGRPAPTSGALNDLWRIGEPEFLRSLEVRGVPQWQLTLIKAIKTTGEQALGKPIVKHAEYGDGFALSQFRDHYPLLAIALQAGTVQPEQIITGGKNIHYWKDHEGLEEALTLLPPTILAGPERISTSLPLTERIPITKLSLRESTPRLEDSLLEGTTDQLLHNLNRYLFLEQARPNTIFTFQHELQKANRIVIPLKRSSKVFDFWVNGPPIDISADGRRLAGNLKIEAVSFFDAGYEEHPPRVLLAYSVNRHWTRECLAFIQGMQIELKERIDLAWRVEGEHVQRKPFQGGGFQGK